MKLTKTKKVLAMLLVAILIIPCGALFTACFNANVVSVSTSQELLDALNGNKEIIKVEKNLELDNYIKVSRKVTFDLNGKTVTGNGVDGIFHIVTGGDLTIKGNGKVVAVGGIDPSDSLEYSSAVFAIGGKVTIENGEFSQQVSGTDDHYDLIYAKGNAQITILSGKFNSVTPAWTLNIKDADRSTANISVKGGTFVGFNPANCLTEGPNTNFVAEGYKSELASGSTTDYVVSRA